MESLASVPLGLLFYGFWQFAIYRTRRYRLTRTVWRGVRFWMTGSGPTDITPANSRENGLPRKTLIYAISST